MVFSNLWICKVVGATNSQEDGFDYTFTLIISSSCVHQLIFFWYLHWHVYSTSSLQACQVTEHQIGIQCYLKWIFASFLSGEEVSEFLNKVKK